MAYYMEAAGKLKSDVDSFLQFVPIEDVPAAAVALGHIINSAVLCNPRKPHGTVRKNIVVEAMKSYCKVTMTKETDERTGREFNKIHILAKGN